MVSNERHGDAARVRKYANALGSRKQPVCPWCVDRDDWSDCSDCDAIVAVGIADAEQAELRARIIQALDPLIEAIEMGESDDPNVCHGYDRIDDGECALVADLLRVRAALDAE